MNKVPKNNRNITFEDARLIFKNFEGKGDKFNPVGKRNFSVLLDEEDAEHLTALGYNVRYLKPREEGDIPQAYMQVMVKYTNYPPKITLISPSTGKQTLLTADDVKILDWTEMQTVDFIISPYDWEVNGKTGITAYLKKMFVTIVEDDLERKYGQFQVQPTIEEPVWEDDVYDD